MFRVFALLFIEKIYVNVLNTFIDQLLSHGIENNTYIG